MDEHLAAFKKLSSTLQAKIQSRPTKTLLADSTEKTRASYAKIGKLWNFEDPDPAAKTPESFDGRIAWKGMLGKVEDQGGCGSCWAFASTATLAQRFNIQSRGLMNIELSQTKLILCDWGGKELRVDHPELPAYSFTLAGDEGGGLNNTACYGNSLIDACRYLYEFGTCTEECVPYNQILDLEIGDFQKIGSFRRGSPAATQLPLCSAVAGPIGDMCAGSHVDVATGEESGTPERFFRAYHFYGLYGVPGEVMLSLHQRDTPRGEQAEKEGGELQIRREIWRWGPVATGMRVYPDFYTFNAAQDIYNWNKKGPQVGGHAIVIVGWGEEKDVKYWIIRNSWGPKWGDGGYFRMVRGSNDCGIEGNAMCMVPDFFYPTGYVMGDDRTSLGPHIPPSPRHDELLPYSDDGSEHGYWNYQKIDSSETIPGATNFRENRNKISDDVLISAGGIDPLTGYTRRVMIVMPWINFQRPVFLEDLPDWSTFVAGRDSTPKARQRIFSEFDALRERSVIESQVKQIYVGVTALLTVLILVVLGLIIYRKLKR
mgnify:CR=1 FL=1